LLGLETGSLEGSGDRKLSATLGTEEGIPYGIEVGDVLKIRDPEGAKDVAIGAKLPERLGTEEKFDWVDVGLALGIVVDKDIGLLEGNLTGFLLGLTLGMEESNVNGIELG